MVKMNMQIKRFTELTKDMELSYLAKGIEEPLPLELLLKQLDRVSGITNMDAYFQGLPFYEASLNLYAFSPNEGYESDDKSFWQNGQCEISIIGFYMHKKKGKCFYTVSELLAVHSEQELTLDHEVKRAAEFIPARFLDCFANNTFGTLPTFHYSVKHEKMSQRPTKQKYTNLLAYWNNEIKPVLLDKDDAEKCRVLTEFAALVYPLEMGMEEKMDRSDPDQEFEMSGRELMLTRRAAANLLRSIQLNSQQDQSRNNIFTDYLTLWNILEKMQK